MPPNQIPPIDSYGLLWDFRIYYAATKAAFLGLNPYDPNVVSTATGILARSDLPFPYPPIALLFFYPFTLFKIETAVWLFLGILILGLVGTLHEWATWTKESFSNIAWWWPPAMTLALSASLLVVTISGNPAPIEAWLVLFGLRRLFAEKKVSALLALTLAATLKINPLLLIVLTLFASPWRKWAPIVSAILAWCALIIAQYLVVPALTMSWIYTASAIALDDNARNFALRQLAHDLLDPFGYYQLAEIVWIVWALAVVALLGRGIYRHDSRPTGTKALRTLTAYLLIVPRLKEYALIQIGPLLGAALGEKRYFPFVLFVATQYYMVVAPASSLLMRAATLFAVMCLTLPLLRKTVRGT